MESFAFWYKEKSDLTGMQQDQLRATMNFNLWCECGWNQRKRFRWINPQKDKPFLDIGFKLTNLHCAEEIYFFLPFKIDEKDKTKCIQDLGGKFQNTSLVDAVFNETSSTTISANKKTINVSVEGQPSFKIYQLDIAHDVILSKFGEGTILTIKTERVLYGGSPTDVYYFRFRIKEFPCEFLIHQYSTPHRAIQSLFHTTYMIDFRYHNVRSLQKSLIEKFNEKSNHVVNVTSLHFLLMTKAYIDMSIDGIKSVRKLEDEIWKDYVDGNDTTDLVAYHFSQKAEKKWDVVEDNDYSKCFIESSELFAKFSIERAVIIWYILITLLIGTVGSIVGTALYPLIQSGFAWILNLIRAIFIA